MVAEKKTYAPMSRGYVLHQLRRVVVAGVYDDSAGLSGATAVVATAPPLGAPEVSNRDGTRGWCNIQCPRYVSVALRSRSMSAFVMMFLLKATSPGQYARWGLPAALTTLSSPSTVLAIRATLR